MIRSLTRAGCAPFEKARQLLGSGDVPFGDGENPHPDRHKLGSGRQPVFGRLKRSPEAPRVGPYRGCGLTDVVDTGADVLAGGLAPPQVEECRLGIPGCGDRVKLHDVGHGFSTIRCEGMPVGGRSGLGIRA